MGKYEIKLLKKKNGNPQKTCGRKKFDEGWGRNFTGWENTKPQQSEFQRFSTFDWNGWRVCFKFRGKEYEIVRTGNDEEIELCKEDGTCDTYPTEESLLNNAKIEEQPIREIAEEFKLW